MGDQLTSHAYIVGEEKLISAFLLWTIVWTFVEALLLELWNSFSNIFFSVKKTFHIFFHIGLWDYIVIKKTLKIMIISNLHGSNNPLFSKSTWGSSCQLLGMLNLKAELKFLVNLIPNDYIRTNITEAKFFHH